MPKNELLIDEISIIEVHHICNGPIGYRVKYVVNGGIKVCLLWEVREKTIEELQKSVIDHEMRNYINNNKCETDIKKPPIGITPHFIWIEQRIDEIKQAINRRIEAKVIIPPQWYTELAQLENEKNTKVR